MPSGKKNLRALHSIENLGIVKAQRGDIRVERLEDRLKPKVAFPHKHDFFQLVFIRTGTGWHEVDFVRHTVVKNQVFVLKPGQVHSWNLSKKTRGFIVEFTSESIPESDLIYEVESLADCFTWNSKKLANPENILELMEQEFQTQDLDFKLCLQKYLAILLYLLFRSGKNSKMRHLLQEDFSRSFSRLVEMHFREQHRLEFYAGQLKTSPKSLSAKIQRTFGKPAKEIIQDRCLLEAKRYLSYSLLTVAEIGYELGFEDPNYFSRFLKQKLRMSAQHFREEFKKNHFET